MATAPSSGQTARQLGAAGSVLASRLRRSRLFMAAMRGAAATWHSLSSAARRLWHEVTGFVFLFFAIAGGSAAVREYHRYTSESRHDATRLIAVIAFSLLFFWFGVSSFWRAWRPTGKKKS